MHRSPFLLSSSSRTTNRRFCHVSQYDGTDSALNATAAVMLVFVCRMISPLIVSVESRRIANGPVGTPVRVYPGQTTK